jgi:ribonuclease HI
MRKIHIFSDGCAVPNPGRGGFGTIIRENGHDTQIFRGYKFTTNNRMELMGVLAGFEGLNEPCEVLICSDSKYVVDCIQGKWYDRWIKKNIQSKKNLDLWYRFAELAQKHHVKAYWVKGHNGHVENEICDALAEKAMNSKGATNDFVYEAVEMRNF